MSAVWVYRHTLSLLRNDQGMAAGICRGYLGSILDASAFLDAAASDFAAL